MSAVASGAGGGFREVGVLNCRWRALSLVSLVQKRVSDQFEAPRNKLANKHTLCDSQTPHPDVEDVWRGEVAPLRSGGVPLRVLRVKVLRERWMSLRGIR